MSEVWLHSNRRLMLPASVPAVMVAVAGLVGVAAGFAAAWRALIGLGLVLMVLGALLAVLAWMYLRRPRLAYRPGSLLVNWSWNQTVAVPIELVECFFMGQAPSAVRGPGGSEAYTATVVVRLAERAESWHRRPMPSHLGQWCDGYVILNGAWCEPIDMDLLTRLNRELAAAHRQQQQAAKAEA